MLGIQDNIEIAGGQARVAGEPAVNHDLCDTVKARLKWFNGPKGFGFVNPEGREDVDAFLHITALQTVGVHAIGDGACLLCQIEYGDKGAHVTQVLDVLDEGQVTEAVPCYSHANDAHLGQVKKMKGTVKWFKADSGFGFIVPDDGLKDVFVHKTCLERQGVDVLEPGQRVFMTLRIVPKGREVINLRLLDSDVL